MSVTFNLVDHSVEPDRYFRVDDYASPLHVNMANDNAIDLLAWLDLGSDIWGSDCELTDLAARCRRRLWPESRNDDPAIEGFTDKTPGRATLVYGGRRAGYLRDRCEQVLRLCEHGIENGYTHCYWG